ncbi:uncharacterized protein LOC118182987 [Stegodyphus dumicola]|uniref:uncharacterized protein LOC118182987 n=1 Tax=Stegodyphus dumicola TaxID=202533 RepID=UPI0015AD5064|nr:uncharacterized protein LOC118182987 [Stegodyphus dumicola]
MKHKRTGLGMTVPCFLWKMFSQETDIDDKSARFVVDHYCISSESFNRNSSSVLGRRAISHKYQLSDYGQSVEDHKQYSVFQDSLQTSLNSVKCHTNGSHPNSSSDKSFGFFSVLNSKPFPRSMHHIDRVAKKRTEKSLERFWMTGADESSILETERKLYLINRSPQKLRNHISVSSIGNLKLHTLKKRAIHQFIFPGTLCKEFDKCEAESRYFPPLRELPNLSQFENNRADIGINENKNSDRESMNSATSNKESTKRMQLKHLKFYSKYKFLDSSNLQQQNNDTLSKSNNTPTKISNSFYLNVHSNVANWVLEKEHDGPKSSPKRNHMFKTEESITAALKRRKRISRPTYLNNTESTAKANMKNGNLHSFRYLNNKTEDLDAILEENIPTLNTNSNISSGNLFESAKSTLGNIQEQFVELVKQNGEEEKKNLYKPQFELGIENVLNISKNEIAEGFETTPRYPAQNITTRTDWNQNFSNVDASASLKPKYDNSDYVIETTAENDSLQNANQKVQTNIGRNESAYFYRNRKLVESSHLNKSENALGTPSGTGLKNEQTTFEVTESTQSFLDNKIEKPVYSSHSENVDSNNFSQSILSSNNSRKKYYRNTPSYISSTAAGLFQNTASNDGKNALLSKITLHPLSRNLDEEINENFKTFFNSSNFNFSTPDDSTLLRDSGIENEIPKTRTSFSPKTSIVSIYAGNYSDSPLSFDDGNFIDLMEETVTQTLSTQSISLPLNYDLNQPNVSSVKFEDEILETQSEANVIKNFSLDNISKISDTTLSFENKFTNSLNIPTFKFQNKTIWDSEEEISDNIVTEKPLTNALRVLYEETEKKSSIDFDIPYSSSKTLSKLYTEPVKTIQSMSSVTRSAGPTNHSAGGQNIKSPESISVATTENKTADSVSSVSIPTALTADIANNLAPSIRSDDNRQKRFPPQTFFDNINNTDVFEETFMRSVSPLPQATITHDGAKEMDDNLVVEKRATNENAFYEETERQSPINSIVTRDSSKSLNDNSVEYLPTIQLTSSENPLTVASVQSAEHSYHIISEQDNKISESIPVRAASNKTLGSISSISTPKPLTKDIENKPHPSISLDVSAIKSFPFDMPHKINSTEELEQDFGSSVYPITFESEDELIHDKTMEASDNVVIEKRATNEHVFYEETEEMSPFNSGISYDSSKTMSNGYINSLPSVQPISTVNSLPLTSIRSAEPTYHLVYEEKTKAPVETSMHTIKNKSSDSIPLISLPVTISANVENETVRSTWDYTEMESERNVFLSSNLTSFSFPFQSNSQTKSFVDEYDEYTGMKTEISRKEEIASITTRSSSSVTETSVSDSEYLNLSPTEEETSASPNVPENSLKSNNHSETSTNTYAIIEKVVTLSESHTSKTAADISTEVSEETEIQESESRNRRVTMEDKNAVTQQQTSSTSNERYSSSDLSANNGQSLSTRKGYIVTELHVWEAVRPKSTDVPNSAVSTSTDYQVNSSNDSDKDIETNSVSTDLHDSTHAVTVTSKISSSTYNQTEPLDTRTEIQTKGNVITENDVVVTTYSTPFSQITTVHMAKTTNNQFPELGTKNQ